MRVTPLLTVLLLALAILPATGVRADEIEDIINQVTTDEQLSYLRVLTGVDPISADPPVYLTNRYSYGTDAVLAAQWIDSQFTSFGLNTTQHTFDPSFAPNVIGELPGTTRPDDIYVISAHYDTYIQYGSQYLAPGADDNGSGTSAVLMAARILSQYQFEGTIRFIAFSGEEQWMVGSDAYAYEASLAGENIVAAINLDMILHPGFDNMDPDPDYDLDLEVNLGSYWLGQYLFWKFTEYTPLDVELHSNDDFVSDHAAFWWHGFDAVGLSENTAYEIWGGSNDSYHQPWDTIYDPDYDWEFARHVIRGGTAGLIGLAGLVPEPSSLTLLSGLILLRGRARR